MDSSIVRTATGPVPSQEIGFCDAHSHLWIDAVDGADRLAPQLVDQKLILNGLEEYAAAGGEAIVDCQPAGCGRDANRLRHLSSTSGIKVIASTGFHRRRYYHPAHALWSMSASQAYDFFMAEAEEGLLETRGGPEPVLPGVIKVAAEQSLDDSPETLFEAAAAASVASDLAIAMHTERGADVERFLVFFGDRGVRPQRLIFCHVDKRPDLGLHLELARAGVLLEYDTFFRPKYKPDKNVWMLVRQMVSAGLAGGIALATDMADHEMWLDPGPAAFIGTIGRRLDQEGINLEDTTKLLGGNIIGRLAVHLNPYQITGDNLVDVVKDIKGAR